MVCMVFICEYLDEGVGVVEILEDVQDFGFVFFEDCDFFFVEVLVKYVDVVDEVFCVDFFVVYFVDVDFEVV